MNKNMFAVLMTLFIVFVGLQFAEPATAAKVVDHGTKYYTIAHPKDTKITWKVYQYNNNYIKIYRNIWDKNLKTKKYYIEIHEITTIAKVTKNSVKITDWNDGVGGGTSVSHAKTKLTAAQYYWRTFRHLCVTQ